MVANGINRFWAEFFRQVAAGQQQVAAMADWIQSGCPPGNALAELLCASYGLPTSNSIGADVWHKRVTEFLTALNAYAPLWGWVPLARYEKLKRKADRLERKVAAQERTIRQLNELLNEKGLGNAVLMTHFQDLIDDQTRAFDELMQTITDAGAADASQSRPS